MGWSPTISASPSPRRRSPDCAGDLPSPWPPGLETTHFASACPQPLPPTDSFYQKEFFRTSERQSEDCLYLNIWTPAHAPDERLPVMVWFYGGGFVQGSGSLPSFAGEALARRGVVVVTINYRLGPLGFLALPALDQESPDRVSGNYGLLDMIAALRWVRDDIAGFGGDPAAPPSSRSRRRRPRIDRKS